MEMNKKNIYNINMIILLGISVLALIGLSIGLGYNLKEILAPKVMAQVYNSNCSNMSLVMTSNCLREELSEFWFYNISQAGKDLTLEELKITGGVCSHSADWYNNRGKELGFEVSKIIFEFNDTTSHAINIMSDSTSYCVQDQETIKCFGFAT